MRQLSVLPECMRGMPRVSSLVRATHIHDLGLRPLQFDPSWQRQAHPRHPLPCAPTFRLPSNLLQTVSFALAYLSLYDFRKTVTRLFAGIWNVRASSMLKVRASFAIASRSGTPHSEFIARNWASNCRLLADVCLPATRYGPYRQRRPPGGRIRLAPRNKACITRAKWMECSSVPLAASSRSPDCGKICERIFAIGSLHHCAVPPVIVPDLSPACIVDDLPEDLQWWQRFGIRTCDRTLAPES